MHSNRSIFETQHPVLSFTLKTIQGIAITTSINIIRTLSTDISKYLAKEGTDAIKGLFLTYKINEDNICIQNINLSLDHKAIGVDASTQITEEQE